MSAKTATNPLGIDDMGYPSSVPVFFQVEMSYTEYFARTLLAQVWYILHNNSNEEAGRSAIRLTFQRPGGQFGRLSNHGVVRVFDKSLGQLAGVTGLAFNSSWLSLPNTGMGERACWVSCAGGDNPSIYQLSRSIAHEMGHCCGLADVFTQGNLMVSASTPSYRDTTTEQRASFQYTFNYWRTNMVK